MLQVNSSFVVFINQYPVVSKLSNNNSAFWAKYSAEGKDCGIKTALSNLAKRYLTLHPSSNKVEKRGSSQLPQMSLMEGTWPLRVKKSWCSSKKTFKLRNFALDWWIVGLLKAIYMYIESFGCWWKSFTVFVFWFSLIGKISEPVPVNL